MSHSYGKNNIFWLLTADNDGALTVYITYLEKWTLSAAHLSYNGSDVSFLDIQVDIMQLFAFTPSKGSFSYLDYIWIIFNMTFDNIRIDFL